jgi:hypothetical protein
MTTAGRVAGALGSLAVFSVFAAVCWFEGNPGVSLLMLFIGGGVAMVFAFASERTIRLIGSLW